MPVTIFPMAHFPMSEIVVRNRLMWLDLLGPISLPQVIRSHEEIPDVDLTHVATLHADREALIELLTGEDEINSGAVFESNRDNLTNASLKLLSQKDFEDQWWSGRRRPVI